MSTQKQWRFRLLAMALALGLSPLACGQEPAATPVARNMSALKFGPVPGMPTCLSAAVENGDPMKGAGLLIAKLTKGCKIPWHWHTAGESIMVVSGKGRIDMTNVKSEILKAGGFASLPSHHAHQFHCIKACTVFIHTDAAFDIHYIGLKGVELPPDEALKAVKEQAPAM